MHLPVRVTWMETITFWPYTKHMKGKDSEKVVREKRKKKAATRERKELWFSWHWGQLKFTQLPVTPESSWILCPGILLHKTSQKRPVFKGNQKMPCFFKYNRRGKGHSKLEFLQHQAIHFSYWWQFYFVLLNNLHENLMTECQQKCRRDLILISNALRMSGKGECANTGNALYKHWPLVNHSRDFRDILGTLMNNKQLLSEIKKIKNGDAMF